MLVPVGVLATVTGSCNLNTLAARADDSELKLNIGPPSVTSLFSPPFYELSTRFFLSAEIRFSTGGRQARQLPSRTRRGFQKSTGRPASAPQWPGRGGRGRPVTAARAERRVTVRMRRQPQVKQLPPGRDPGRARGPGGSPGNPETGTVGSAQQTDRVGLENLNDHRIPATGWPTRRCGCPARPGPGPGRSSGTLDMFDIVCQTYDICILRY